MIRPYLNDMINYHKTQGEWKIHLTMSINSMSSKDCEETSTMHTNSHNVDIVMGSKVDEIIKELLNLLYKNIKKNWKNQ